ncbi:ImmA/IrrE family metallo-endopeptidase [Roseateles sp. LYH14W]|uniref:ImmA/IrrE family metallo-endopeptidase n=1 Tax=Pelomonas parva TaxID=3299032 RepID=A0ABW7F8X3_9BURK
MQANTFARELLLPRDVARNLYFAGKTAEQLSMELDLPLELVRQQLFDALLLPEPPPEVPKPPKVIIPTQEQIDAAQSDAVTSLVKAGPGSARDARHSTAGRSGSQTHKERAVEHHRDHGHCIAATIKALGYPSRSLLSTWIQALNPRARAPAFVGDVH